MEHAFPPGKDRKTGLPFQNSTFFHGIFQWNKREACVLLTTEPKFPQFLDKLIQD